MFQKVNWKFHYYTYFQINKHVIIKYEIFNYVVNQLTIPMIECPSKS